MTSENDVVYGLVVVCVASCGRSSRVFIVVAAGDAQCTIFVGACTDRV